MFTKIILFCCFKAEKPHTIALVYLHNGSLQYFKASLEYASKSRKQPQKRKKTKRSQQKKIVIINKNLSDAVATLMKACSSPANSTQGSRRAHTKILITATFPQAPAL